MTSNDDADDERRKVPPGALAHLVGQIADWPRKRLIRGKFGRAGAP
jgi:hypothetical protein